MLKGGSRRRIMGIWSWIEVWRKKHLIHPNPLKYLKKAHLEKKYRLIISKTFDSYYTALKMIVSPL
jgi:hypothetical protein